MLNRTESFDGLVDLENSAREAEQRFPESPHIAALVGTILRKRLEWDVSSAYFLQMAIKFPDALDIDTMER